MKQFIYIKRDLKTKLEYAFETYDLDGNGYLDQNEIQTVLVGMLDMLGASKNTHNLNALASQIMKDLDSSQDGRVSKEEFVQKLLTQPSLRSLLNPFI